MLKYIVFAICISAISATLLEDRLQNIGIQASRFDVNDYPTFYALSASIYDITVMIHGIMWTGEFGPQDFIEYAANLIPTPWAPTPNIRHKVTPDWATLEILDEDIYKLTQTTRSFVGYNTSLPLNYTYVFDGVRNEQYFKFAPNSSTIIRQYSTIDRDQNDFYTQFTGSLFDVDLICQIAMAACDDTPHLNKTGFSSFAECKAQYLAVEAQGSPCRAKFTSLTPECLVLHAVNALPFPHIHCAHLNVQESPTCINRCLPDCASCSENAHCAEQFNETSLLASGFDFDEAIDYRCECNEGYVGNGTVCAPKTCSGDNQCPSGNPYSWCDNGDCKCVNNLSWNGLNETCECLETENQFWNNQGEPYCLRNGKCHEKSHCPQTDYSSFECRQFEYPNTLTPGDWCLCNDGYDNVGIDHDCVCSSPKTTKWSPAHAGRVCLASDECTIGWHCASGNCNATGATIGHCI